MLEKDAPQKKQPDNGAEPAKCFAPDMVRNHSIHLSSIHEFCFKTDADGILLQADAPGLALLGYAKENIHAHFAATDLIAPADRGRAMENIHRILSGERLGLHAYQMIDKAGASFPVLIAGRPSRSTGGLNGTVFLLPSSAHFAELLWEDQETNRAVLEAIPCGLYMVNRQGRISHWNPVAEKITGLSRSQVIGKSCQDIFDCPHRSTAACPLTTGADLPENPLSTEVALESGGRMIHIFKNSNYIKDTEGRVIGAIESFVDLTRQHEAEAVLNEARELVVSARQAKRHFMANMSHEIRTPINGIIGLLDILLQSETRPFQREHLTTAKQSARLLMNLIGDILDFTIIDKGTLNIEYTGFSLRSIIASAIARQYDLTRNRAVFIHSQIDDDVPDNLLGDSGHLYQILKHLLGNALKFTPAGEVAVRVAREPGRERASGEPARAIWLHFSVSDTGVGISEAQLKTIFESLSQGDGSSTRSYGGLGIGLNIVHRLVAMLEGRIWVESKPQKGTTVHFVLAFRSAYDGDGRRDNSPFPGALQSHCSPTAPSLRAAEEAHTAAPTLSWLQKCRQAMELVASDRESAEHQIAELRTALQEGERNPLAGLLLRLLLALRRNDEAAISTFQTRVVQELSEVRIHPRHAGEPREA